MLNKSRAFLGQLPLIIICILVAWYGLPSSLNQSKTDSDQNNSQSRAPDLDYGGIISFATAIVILLFLIQSSSTTYETSSLPYVLTPAFAIAVAAFVLTEAYWARKPLIPLSLVKGSLRGYCVGQLMLITGRSAVSLMLEQPRFPTDKSLVYSSAVIWYHTLSESKRPLISSHHLPTSSLRWASPSVA